MPPGSTYLPWASMTCWAPIASKAPWLASATTFPSCRATSKGRTVYSFATRPFLTNKSYITECSPLGDGSERGLETLPAASGYTTPQVMLTEFVVCGTNLAACEEEARQYQGKFVESNFYHYEFLGDHFKTVKGYDAYQQKAEIARKGGLEGAVDGFMKAASWGTPDKILRGLEERRKMIGDLELNVALRFGGP